MLETLHRKKHLTSFQFIILGFAGIIFVGAFISKAGPPAAGEGISSSNRPQRICSERS